VGGLCKGRLETWCRADGGRQSCGGRVSYWLTRLEKGTLGKDLSARPRDSKGRELQLRGEGGITGERRREMLRMKCRAWSFDLKRNLSEKKITKWGTESKRGRIRVSLKKN